MIGGSALSVVLLFIVMVTETKHKREMLRNTNNR